MTKKRAQLGFKDAMKEGWVPSLTQVYEGSRVHCYSDVCPRLDPQLRYSVRFGDTGYECDPGVEDETLPTAIAEVREAVRELGELLAVLEGIARTGRADGPAAE